MFQFRIWSVSLIALFTRHHWFFNHLFSFPSLSLFRARAFSLMIDHFRIEHHAYILNDDHRQKPSKKKRTTMTREKKKEKPRVVVQSGRTSEEDISFDKNWPNESRYSPHWKLNETIASGLPWSNDQKPTNVLRSEDIFSFCRERARAPFSLSLRSSRFSIQSSVTYLCAYFTHKFTLICSLTWAFLLKFP